jgi:biopolymer transport protein ExbD
MAMAVAGRQGVLSEMNVVPLIDILLVLLIIFMVISPVTPVGLDAHLPQPAPVAPVRNTPEYPIVVQVGTGGRLLINRQPIAWDHLAARMEEIFASRAERVAFVQGDQDVLFAEVARAIDILRGAHIHTVGLLTPAAARNQS